MLGLRKGSAMLVPLALLALVILTALQTSPWVVQTPGHDSGIFLFFGSRILNGQIPFTDLWDHKPPLVFYLNALGLLAGGGSRWGVWALQVVFLLASVAFGFATLRRAFGRGAALLAVVGFLASLSFLLEGGNLTEQYALAFQFLALFAFLRGEDTPRPARWDILSGLGLGCAFLLKQTLIGVWLAVGLLLTVRAALRANRSDWLRLARMLAAALAVVAACLLYFAAAGALREFWDVAFFYNFVYSDVTTQDRIASLGTVLNLLLSRSGFFMLALAAWFAGWAYALLHSERLAWHATRRWAGLAPLAPALLLLYSGLFVTGLRPYALTDLSPYRWGLIAGGVTLLVPALAFFSGWFARCAYPWLVSRGPLAGWPNAQRWSSDACVLPLLAIALLDLPIELSLVAVSGKGYQHYIMSLLPALTVLLGFAGGWLANYTRPEQAAMARVWLAALLIPVALPGLLLNVQKIKPGSDRQISETVQMITAQTSVDDAILVWGGQTVVYYLANRDSASRYVHQFPLFTPGYASPQHSAELLAELKTRPPKLIVDSLLYSAPLVYNADDPAQCAHPDPSKADTHGPIPESMFNVYAFICQNYAFQEAVGPDAWRVYVKK